MDIDLLLSECKTSSNNRVFGLCDDLPPAENPAYISEDRDTTWIAQVINSDNKEVDFYAIDHCVDISKIDELEKQESRCDGMLLVDNYYKFIELKDCKLTNREWRRKGRAQLAITINIFKKSNPSISINNISAQLCNKKHRSTILYQESEDEFFENTGIILKINRQVTL